MGGLKVEISKGIWMFKPKTLKEIISLARMCDDQLLRQWWLHNHCQLKLIKLRRRLHPHHLWCGWHRIKCINDEHNAFFSTAMRYSLWAKSVKEHNYYFLKGLGEIVYEEITDAMPEESTQELQAEPDIITHITNSGKMLHGRTRPPWG